MTNHTTEPDIMDRQWVCMACNSKFRWGKMKMGAYSERLPHGVGCPNCGDGRQVHPADGETVELDAYDGKMGPLQ